MTSPDRLRTYGAAILSVVLAILIRILLASVSAERLSFLPFFAALLFAAWDGGVGPSLVALVLGSLSAAFLDPRAPFIVPSMEQVVEIGLFLLFGGASAFLVGRLRKNSASAQGEKQARQLTESRQTAEVEQEWLRVTLNSIGDAVITTDLAGRVTFLNPTAANLTGWPLEQAIGQPLELVFRIVNEDTRKPVESPAAKALCEGQIVGLANHTILVSRTAKEWCIDDSAAPIQDKKGTVTGVVLVFRDVTEHRRSERSARFLASIVESSNDAIIGKDTNGVITSWNRSAERIFGYSAAEAVGQPITMLAPADRMDEMPDILDRIKRGERVEHFDTERRARDGRLIPISLTVSPIKDEDGRIIGASKIARDVSERKRAEQALQESNAALRQLTEQLAEADRRKDEFLATLAHELRNPLAPLRNGLQVMRLASHDSAAVERARAMMERQLAQLVRLVDDLLDVSRISRGKVYLRKERVELARVLQYAVETSRPLIDAAGHQFVFTPPAQPILVDADVNRLAQVFANLLNNATKYTPEGGRISLTVERQGSDAVVVVKDTGVGIPAAMLPRIFEPFTQVERSLERSQGGLGIGLTLVKGLVEMHSGSVEAHSDGLGQGAEFVVRLPIVMEQSLGEPSSATSEQPQPATGRRILVVDDNRDSADSLTMLLRCMGNEVATAYDGLEALAVAETFRPDVILLDLGLPRMNGYEVARRIREQPWGRNMVLIAVTGWGQEDDRKRSKEMGFDHHMVKPVDRTALEALLAGMQLAERK